MMTVIAEMLEFKLRYEMSLQWNYHQ